MVTFATMGLSDEEELDQKIRELAGFPSVKIKADSTGDLSTAGRVRAAMPEARIAIDANCAWEGVDFVKLAPDLASLAIEFIEQPFPPARDAEVSALRTGIPIIADESCVIAEDVERIPGRYAGFNIKLVKCGGLTPALRMARHGRGLGLLTMVGCMLESSLLIAAGAVAAIHAWDFAQGTLHPSDSPGLGASVRTLP